MTKIIIDANPPSEIDAENSQITGHAKDSRSDKSVSKKIEAIKSDVYSGRCEIKRMGEDNRSLRNELIKHTVKNEKLKVDADSTSAELRELKVKMKAEFKLVRAESDLLRNQLNEMRASAQVKDAVTALGVGVLAKAIVKKALPWRK